MDETSFLREVARYLWVVISGIAAWLLNKQESRIKALEDNMYSKSNAAERRSEVGKELDARRQEIIDLDRSTDARFEKVTDRMDDLRNAMNAGFSDIKDLLLRNR